MRVLIVGCGYVGVPLGAELVRLGHEVFGLRRSHAAEDELKAAGIRPLIGDVTRPETLATLPHDFDWVVNCVAAGGNADNYRAIYLQGTRNLIEWLAPKPPKKFVYTSSTSVYAQNDGSQVKESSPTEPLAETSKILVETEKVLLAAVAEQKFPAVILRVAGMVEPRRIVIGDLELARNGQAAGRRRDGEEARERAGLYVRGPERRSAGGRTGNGARENARTA